MKFHFQQAGRAMILLAFSALIFKLHYSGEITKYINPKYEGLSQAALVLFVLLFFIQITRVWTEKEKSDHQCDHCCDHDHGESTFPLRKFVSYTIIIFPIVTGFFLPVKVLDATIANKKGGMAMLSNQNQPSQGKEFEEGNQEDQEEKLLENEDDSSPIVEQKEVSNEELEQIINKLQKSRNIVMDPAVFNTFYEEISKDIQKYKGRNIRLKGFVYKEEGFASNQLVLSRFLITHCVADANIIGFLSEFEEASTIGEDTWLEVEGKLDITTYNGLKLPLLKITKWKQVNEPKEPYIYPMNVRIL